MPASKPLTLCLLAALLLAGGCASDGPTLLNPFSSSQNRQLEKLEAAELYRSGRASLDAGDSKAALEFFRRLDARYPFTKYATQGQLESIYAHYRAFEREQALVAASRFIKQHPRHPDIDYIYYLRGVIYQESIDESLERILNIDSSRRSPQAAKQAFEAFALVIQRYPSSPYAQDARQRMIWLRGRLASYELYVAEYYLRRRAYVAASRRCQQILQKFQGTDVIPRTLEIMEQSYKALGLTELARNARKIRKHNFPAGQAAIATNNKAAVAKNNKAAVTSHEKAVVREENDGWWDVE